MKSLYQYPGSMFLLSLFIFAASLASRSFYQPIYNKAFSTREPKNIPFPGHCLNTYIPLASIIYWRDELESVLVVAEDHQVLTPLGCWQRGNSTTYWGCRKKTGTLMFRQVQRKVLAQHTQVPEAIEHLLCGYSKVIDIKSVVT